MNDCVIVITFHLNQWFKFIVVFHNQLDSIVSSSSFVIANIWSRSMKLLHILIINRNIWPGGNSSLQVHVSHMPVFKEAQAVNHFEPKTIEA